jgi:hypothetical protein
LHVRNLSGRQPFENTIAWCVAIGVHLYMTSGELPEITSAFAGKRRAKKCYKLFC